MSEEINQEEMRVIQDLTEKVKQEIQKFYDFPSEVKIQRAELLIGSDGWNGYTYFVKITYEIDGVQYEKTERIYHSLVGTLAKFLSEIKDFYERMHLIQ